MRLRWLTLTLAMLLAACHRAPESKPFVVRDAPVVLISIDTLRSDHLPAYGYRGVQTPNLDRFRKDAVLFANAWSHCPMTLPSHLSMLTGLLPPEHGVRDNVGFRFDASRHETLQALLRARGYATGAAVSAHVLSADTGIGSGFDTYDDALDLHPGARFRDYQRSGFATEAVAGRWIDEHKARKFFYFLHLYEPHVPYDPPEPFLSQYANRYDGEIATADAIVGRFLDRLRAAGIYDRALIIITSDHGEGLGDHGEQQHSILVYREAIQVPMIVKLPGGRRAGESVAAPAQHIDIFPTVTSLLGIGSGESHRGESLLALNATSVPRTVYSESQYARLHFGWSALRSVVDAKRHLIATATRNELYDLEADRREQRDVAAAQRREAAALRAALEKVPADLPSPSPIDPQEAAKLAAIGYVGSTRSHGDDSVDPHDRIAIVETLRLAMEKPSPEAIQSLRTLATASPAMVEVWMQLGALLALEGRAVEASDAYRSAIRHSAVLLPEALLGAGDAELQQGHIDEAARLGELALATLPRDAHLLLMRVALTSNDLDAATRHARAAANADPQPSDDVLFAEIASSRGAYAESLDLLARAEQRARASGIGHVYRLDAIRGDALARTDRPAEAAAAYEREIAAFPYDLRAYANLAILQFISGDIRAKERTLEAMVAANPTPAARALAAKTRAALR
ncbi:MAG: sulfatase-like hydrolase/transferase [Acidobacteriota bacterium]